MSKCPVIAFQSTEFLPEIKRIFQILPNTDVTTCYFSIKNFFKCLEKKVIFPGFESGTSYIPEHCSNQYANEPCCKCFSPLYTYLSFKPKLQGRK
jgi:hypothetical protein